MDPSNDPFRTSNEAAAQLDMRPNTLSSWRSRGIGPEYVRVGGEGGEIRYRQSSIDAWLAKQTVPEGRKPKTSIWPRRSVWNLAD